MTLTGPIIAGGHFTWEEVWRTKGHPDLEPANRAALEADPVAQACVVRVATDLMEPIRAHWGEVDVHSWWRCLTLNTAVQGNPRSQHMLGQACDFHAVHAGVVELFDWIRTSGLRWGQLILEPMGPGVDTWVHLSLGEPYRSAHLCQQVIR